MTTKAVKALFWKEYRQQIMLWVAIFLLGVIFQLSTYAMSLLHNDHRAYFWTLGMFVTALYAAGSAGVLFAREHDEKTFGFLRSLPLTADTILVGKLAWLLGSTLWLGIAMGLESLLWVGMAGTADSGASIFGVMGVAVVEALCWGLFWSVRSKSQLNSLLATFLCASVGAYVMAVFWNAMFGKGNNEILTAYAGGAPLRLLLAGTIGAIAIVNARKWLYRQFDKPLESLTTEQLAVQSKKMLTPPKRGQMRWLVWHAFRQSRASFGYLAAVFAMMILMLVAERMNWIASDAMFELGVFLGIAVFAGLIFCSSVFFRDQQNKAAAMLTNVGVAPGKVWWSRVIVFGLAYAIYCVPLIIAYMTVAYGKGGDFFYFFLCFEPGYHSYFQHGITDRHQSLFVAMTLFAAIFCIGQMVSLFQRSVIAAMAVMAGMFCGVFFWVMAVKYMLGYSGILWAVWPLLIACLVASRLRTANWQRGRNNWRAWRSPVLAVVVPTLVVLCAVPLVRVYSVPSIYLGYTVDPSALNHNIDIKENQETLRKNHAVLWNDHLTEEDRLRVAINVMEGTKLSLSDPKHAVRNTNMNYSDIRWSIERLSASENVTPEMLKELIAAMENFSQKRPPLREIVARNYEIEYRDALYGTMEGFERGDGHTYILPLVKQPLWYRVGLPWEKYRVMRRLDYEFQVQSQLADEIDQLVYRNQGNFEQIERKADVLDHHRMEQHREIMQQRSVLLGHYWWTPTSSPWYVFQEESRYRALMIELALQAFYLEHGELPETLVELEGEYLTRVPTVPATGDTFLYFPHPDPEVIIGYAPETGEEYRGVPYLQLPRYKFDRFGSNEGDVYHLNFLRKKNDAEE